VRLDDEIVRDTGFPVETIDVLSKVFEEKRLFVEQVDEGVRYCGTVFAGVELVCEGVEGEGILTEEGDVKDCFCVGEVEAGEVGVETGFGGAEVGDTGRG